MKLDALKEVMIRGLAKTKEYSPTILTVMAVGGVVSTVYFAVTGTTKASKIINEEKIRIAKAGDILENPSVEEFNEIVVTPSEMAKLTWKCYIPTAVSAGMTIACVIGANSINLKRNAAIAGLYAISEGKIADYEAKIDELLPKKEAQKLKEGVAEKRLQDHPYEESKVILTGKGDFLCLDSYSGRYFRTNRDELEKAENIFNKRLIGEFCLSLNDLYEILDLEYTTAGDSVGWNSDNLMEFDFTTKVHPDTGEPCLVMDWKTPPSFMYRG